MVICKHRVYEQVIPLLILKGLHHRRMGPFKFFWGGTNISWGREDNSFEVIRYETLQRGGVWEGVSPSHGRDPLFGNLLKPGFIGAL